MSTQAGAMLEKAAEFCRAFSQETRTETILLVEDEAFVRDVTGEVLRSAGYRVLTAANADEAMSAHERRSAEVDLLLTDIVLPGQDGLRLAARLKEPSPRLKVLFVTGYGERMGQHKPDDSDWLAKPFSSETLLGRVRQLLDRDQLRIEQSKAGGNGLETTGQEQRAWSGALTVAGSLQDLSRNLRKRDDAAEDAHLGAGAGHAVDGAGGFVLADGDASAAVDGLHPFGAI
jgi:DNA-binding NtrC family response regulator